MLRDRAKFFGKKGLRIVPEILIFSPEMVTNPYKRKTVKFNMMTRLYES